MNNTTFQFNILKPPLLIYIGSMKQKEIYFSPHIHKDVAEFVYIKNATGTIKMYNSTFKIEKNTLVIFNPNVYHEEAYFSSDGNDIELYYFAITDYVINSNTNSNILPLSTPINIQVDDITFEELNNLLKKTLLEFQEKSLGYEHLVSALCLQLYIETIRLFNDTYNCFSSLYNDKDIIVDNIKKYIDDNFNNPDLQISDLEKKLHLSHYYFSRLFKKKTNITIKAYLINKRMAYASNKLRHSNDTVSKIAKDSGYNDIYHFLKEFKKHYGVTPSTYKKNSRIENDKEED